MLVLLFIPFLLFANAIENNISSIYKKIYPNIKIEKIILKNYKNQPIKTITLLNVNPKKESGVLKINDIFFVFYKLKAKVQILKSSTIINKNDKLNENNTQLTWIDFKNFYSFPISKYTNKIAKMYIPKNKIIYDYMLTTPNIISIGQNINIISSSGGIEISFQAKAMQNGKTGEKIKVKKDNKIFFVTIDKNGNGIL